MLHLILSDVDPTLGSLMAEFCVGMATLGLIWPTHLQIGDVFKLGFWFLLV